MSNCYVIAQALRGACWYIFQLILALVIFLLLLPLVNTCIPLGFRHGSEINERPYLALLEADKLVRRLYISIWDALPLPS